MAYAEDYSPTQRLILVDTSHDANLHSFLNPVLAVFSALTTAGVVFGFQALRPILIENGVYDHLCAADEEKPCTAQILRFNLMFAIASTGTNVFALPIGHFLDYFGPRLAILVGSFLFLIGGVLFGISSPTFDFYIVGYAFLAVGGPFMYISCMHLSQAFPARAGLIMAALTGSFDASSLIYLIFSWIYYALGSTIPIQRFFIFYSIVPIAIGITMNCLMPTTSFTPRPLTPLGDDDNVEDETRPLIDRTEASGKDTTTALVFKQLRSAEFIGIASLTCIYMLKMNFFIGSLEEQLLDKPGAIQNPKLVDSILNLFNVALPAGGILAIPFIGLLLDNYTPSTVIFVLTGLGLSFGILGIIPNLQLQYVTALFFTLLRPLVYTTGNDYCGKTFGFVTFGRVYGTMNLAAGGFNLIQYLLSYIALNFMHGQYWGVNLVVTILQVSMIAFPIYLLYRPTPQNRWEVDYEPIPSSANGNGIHHA
ncbi:hypothetical protein SmJEL517_g04220 [Synchytrium microbalum]|uniref:Major facilitator superfamily (MFS) profile domain-containing protein n=1 Tax=Synchytrium microbalum TaxID=1806994 RepID=A0A507BZ38_9FUNG|nr:uncharacterized protein SmJEL517_g04220 [Synchytrium microbalum]TPX32692.1 hypothetical protein SmJEL517_g04220 [Synchytrium microbalum]